MIKSLPSGDSFSSVNPAHFEALQVESSETTQQRKSTIDLSLPTNSKRNTIFLLLNAMVGSGIFNISHVFAKTGIGSGMFLLILTSVFVWLGLVDTKNSNKQTKPQPTNF